jgi:D-alanyl-D-alanine carboxypeptidase (penicillin-binding protein 5/6)
MKTPLLARSLVLAFGCVLPALGHAEVKIPEPPAIDAKAWAILDYASGELIAGSHADDRVEPASITKVMTVYIALDEVRKGRLKLDDTALISQKAWKQGIDSSESRMFLDVGSRVKIDDLLRGIIIQSGNDASVAVAEHIAGSEDAFAQLMNQYVKQLGMKDTLYADASGVTDAPHYSTAHDLTVLARALIHDFPDSYKIFAEREFTWHGIHQPNRNGLLEKDPSVDGIKTGHTSAAGYCLLASAQRDGRRYITAVMGSPSWAGREQSSLELLNYAFRFYENIPLFGPAAPVATLKVYKGAEAAIGVGTLEPVNIVLPRGARDQLQVMQQVEPRAIAPIAAGQKLGTATISLDGKPLRTVDLVALKDVPAGGFWRRLIDQIKLWFGL